MLVTDLIAWWYGAGWQLRLQMLRRHMQNWVEYFSIGTLARTLFSPWRQTVTIARPDQSLQDKLRALVDNGISRIVGFWARSSVMFAGLLIVALVFVFNVAVVVLWPLLPVAPLLLLALGLST